MNTQQLRNSILQQAIQGKLVPQDPNDEPASMLLERLNEIRATLLKKGEIKRKDTLFFEVTDEENKFEIPKNWHWFHLKDLFHFINGDRGKNYPSKDKLHEVGEHPFISAINIQGKSISKDKLLYLTQDQYEALGSGKLKKNDIVLCIRGSLGKSAIYPFDSGAIASSLVILRKYGEFIDSNFALYYIQSPHFFVNIDSFDNGTAQPNLSADNVANFPIPLPPLAEQRRIVAKLEELLPLVEQYGKAQDDLDALNADLPRRLRQSILQEAIQGKLVPQDPNDEPASVLLDRIRKEKEQLVKEGKLKPKDLVTTPIAEEDIPFDIPESWKWVHLGEISTYSYTKKKINATNAANNVWGLDLEDIEKGGRLLKKLTLGERRAIGDKTFFSKGNILYSKLRPYLLKILIAPSDGICTPEIIPFDCFGKIDHNYMVYLLKSPYVDEYINSASYGVKMPRVGTETMTSLLIPLPPLSEQHRIVAKIEQLFTEIDKLV